MVEQLICNQQVKGSSPFVSSLPKQRKTVRTQQPRARRHAGSVVRGSFVRRQGTVGCPSGQREQTVNLPASAYEGSNPSPTTRRAGVAQLVEHQPSKLRVAGSSPVARSRSRSSVGRARPW